jgi:hypothetical protein
VLSMVSLLLYPVHLTFPLFFSWSWVRRGCGNGVMVLLFCSCYIVTLYSFLGFLVIEFISFIHVSCVTTTFALVHLVVYTSSSAYHIR